MRGECSEQSEANNRGLFEIPQYLYIIIYLYICLSAHALHKTMHTLHKSYHIDPLCIAFQNTGCCLEHHFEKLPFRWLWPMTPVQLKTAWTTTATWVVPNTATEHRKCSSSQTEAQREE